MKTFTLILLVLFTRIGFTQTVENANVYPSNLEENMYFSNFNQATNTLQGLYFMILSDGNNSKHVTPAFEVSIYLLPEGSTRREDLIVIKKYQLDGIYHFGSNEFKNEIINLNETAGIIPGNYRVGIWVNSNAAFEEDRSDNAALFRNTITIKNATTGSATPIKPSEQKDKVKDDDGWDNWNDEVDDDDEEEW